MEQTFSDWELIIVDDHSSDTSVETIKPFLNNQRIRLIQNDQNRGANYSRNKGIAAAIGEYVLFLDADDLLDKHCLEHRLAKAREYPQGDLWIFGMGVFYRTPSDDKRIWKPTSKNVLNDFLQHDLPWSILQPIWRRSFLASTGGFDEVFERLQDVELHTRVLLQGAKYYQFPQIIDCFYRIDESRKNFNSYEFLQKHVRSCKKYIIKFNSIVEQHQKKYLAGTVLRAFHLAILHFRQGSINKKEFQSLINDLSHATSYLNWNAFQKTLFKLFYLYNQWSPQIPGVNRLLSAAIIRFSFNHLNLTIAF